MFFRCGSSGRPTIASVEQGGSFRLSILKTEPRCHFSADFRLHYRSSSPRLPKATRTPTAGRRAARQAPTVHWPSSTKIQNNLKAEARPQNIWEARESNSRTGQTDMCNVHENSPGGWVGHNSSMQRRKRWPAAHMRSLRQRKIFHGS